VAVAQLEWCGRATAAGFSLLHDDRLRVAHPTRSDWPALARKWRRLTEESWALEGRGVGGGGPAALGRTGADHDPLDSSLCAKGAASSRPARRGRAVGSAGHRSARLRLVRCGWMLRQAAGGRI